LIFLRGCAGSIDNSDVVENEDRRINVYEGSDIALLLSLGKHSGREEQEPTQEQDTHPITSFDLIDNSARGANSIPAALEWKRQGVAEAAQRARDSRSLKIRRLISARLQGFE
jgi:hypothetical protein